MGRRLHLIRFQMWEFPIEPRDLLLGRGREPIDGSEQDSHPACLDLNGGRKPRFCLDRVLNRADEDGVLHYGNHHAARREVCHQFLPGLLGRVLDTFSQQLCSAGLVEKGLTGELGARLLLLLARDFVAPEEGEHGRNLLKPVRLLDMLHVLFGNNTWAMEHRRAYSEAFKTAHVNFTHWIVTKDPLPDTSDQ